MKRVVKFPDGDYVHGLSRKGQVTSVSDQRLAVFWDDNDGHDATAKEHAYQFARLINGRVVCLKPRSAPSESEGK